jgi:hypothetical protein
MPELSDVLIDVWNQVLVHDSKVVKIGSEQFPVSTSKKKHRRQVEFVFDGMTIVGIQQNPDTKSHWAKEARSGQKVMQFIQGGRYIGVVAAGKMTCMKCITPELIRNSFRWGQHKFSPLHNSLHNCSQTRPNQPNRADFGSCNRMKTTGTG